MQKKLQQGFTLIELLVVIAIIGILAAVVLASLNDARDSGQDASIKQSIGNARSQAELVYNQTNFSYDNGTNGVCNNTSVINLTTAAANNRAEVTTKTLAVDAAFAAERVMCHDIASGYMIMAPLNVVQGANTHWCVDSAGFAGAVAPAAMSGAADITCG